MAYIGPVTLVSIAVAPANPSVPTGVTQQFTATGTYSDGTSRDITTQVTWTSSSTSTATIASSGLAMGVAAGTTAITATSGNISGNTALRITAAILTSISLTPVNPSVPAGNPQQFTASGTYSDGTTRDITTQVTWSSSNTSVATVNNSGLATGVAAGTATITAALSGKTGTATLTVTAATLSSIAVTPATASIAAGSTQQFSASGTYSDGTTRDITTQVTWTSLLTATATTNSSGLATGVAAGTATITAALSGKTGTATLTVTAATLSSIAVTPATASIAAGSTQQFSASGTYSDGTSHDITTQVTWTSLPTATATINSSGLATGVAAGTATITAALSGKTGTATLTVTLATLSSISVTPANPSIPAGNTQQFTATGTYSDGTSHDITTQVTWSSSNTSVATVNSSGLATAGLAGMTIITAEANLGMVWGVTFLTVTAASLTSIAITPANPSIAGGNKQQFTATGTYSDGTSRDISTQVTWSSSNTSVATVNSSGLATAVAAGTATITATSGAISGSTILTVTSGGSAGNNYNVTTIAGTAGANGWADGTGAAARFDGPQGIATDGANLYVADTFSATIRKIVISTGAVTTIAGTAYYVGSADGTGAAARFNEPVGITTDGTNLYVTDYGNHTIRKIVISTGAVTTIAGTAGAKGSADGTGAAARFFNPLGITTDGANLYVADSLNETIRKIVISTGAVTTIAGTPGATGAADGTGAVARFYDPFGITTDGANLYVADSLNETIRKIVISTGAVTTIAGTPGGVGSADGTGAAAWFYYPAGITTDGANLYVVNNGSDTIRKIVISTGAVTTIAGTADAVGSADGTGAAARFKTPSGMTTDGTNLYVADTGNYTIRKIY